MPVSFRVIGLRSSIAQYRRLSAVTRTDPTRRDARIRTNAAAPPSAANACRRYRRTHTAAAAERMLPPPLNACCRRR
jgi:hypothetical protein